MSSSSFRGCTGSLVRFVVIGLFGVFSASVSNHAFGTDAPAAVGPQEVSGIIADGLTFEEQGQWADAIQHYEDALRDWHDHPQLRQRLLIARLHYDVDRRYQDGSFLDAVKRTPPEQVLDLYLEVLANLETHYVDVPRWNDVVRYGTASLEVALTEPRFVQTHLSTVSSQQVEDVRLNIHREVVRRPSDTRFDLRSSAWHVANVVNARLGLPKSAVIFEYVCGAISTLDPYTRFLTPSQLDDTFSNIEGNFVGLGVELKAAADRLRIINVIPGGPAEEAGLKPGESIVSVAGTSTQSENPDAVADLLRGPEHSEVALQVVGVDGVQRALRVQRRRVEVPSVEQVRIIDEEQGIGYFRLTNFQVTTIKDVERALWQLQRQGMRQLIIDLRGNPGGVLTAAVDVADRFVDRGRITSTRGRNGHENFEYFAHRPNTWNMPLYVLIDGDSASASEIFAGAMRDAGRAVIVGQQSYGKGSVQGIFRMSSAPVGLCLTTAKWYTPKNSSVSQRGVTPDLSVTPTYIMARPTETGEVATQADDAILAAAVKRARGESRVSSLSSTSK